MFVCFPLSLQIVLQLVLLPGSTQRNTSGLLSRGLIHGSVHMLFFLQKLPEINFCTIQMNLFSYEFMSINSISRLCEPNRPHFEILFVYIISY